MHYPLSSLCIQDQLIAAALIYIVAETFRKNLVSSARKEIKFT